MAAVRASRSMRTATVKSSRLARDDLRITHEGWVEHFSNANQGLIRYWMILSEYELQFYSVATYSGQRQLCHKIAIGSDTKINNSAEQYGFELITSSTVGQQGDVLRFKNENDRDLWKAYIIGLTSRNVPTDVNLLPGQLRDVLCALNELPAPVPPVQTVRSRSTIHQHSVSSRPGLDLPAVPQSASISSPAAEATTTDEDSLPPADYSDDDDGEVAAYAIGDGKVSVRFGHGSTKGQIMVEEDAGSGDVAAGETPMTGLQQLLLRQSSLAFKTLDDEQKPKRGHLTSPFIRHWQPSSGDLQRSRSHSAGVNHVPLGSNSVRFFVNEKTWRDRVQPQTERFGRNAKHFNNNNGGFEMHPFFADPLKNRFPPSWFVECDRETAEGVLLASRLHGNVLMRPSAASVAHSGRYGITMRCDEPSGSRILHYAVFQVTSGFKIAVENPHRPMLCLSEVMEFFVDVVGVSARPLRHVLGVIPNSLTSWVASPSPTSPSQGVVNHATTPEFGSSITAGQPSNFDEESTGPGHQDQSPRDDDRPGSTSLVSTVAVISDRSSESSSPTVRGWPPAPQQSSAGNNVSLPPSMHAAAAAAAGRQRVILNSTVSGPRSPFHPS